MDTKSMPGRQRKKSKLTQVQLVHYRPCFKGAMLRDFLFPCAASERGGRWSASHRWLQYTPFIAAITNQELQWQMLRIFYATLINDMHFLLPSENRSTLPLCDRLHNVPPLFIPPYASCCCWSLHTRLSPLHRVLCEFISVGQSPGALSKYLAQSYRAAKNQDLCISSVLFTTDTVSQTFPAGHFPALHGYTGFGNRHLAKNHFIHNEQKS